MIKNCRFLHSHALLLLCLFVPVALCSTARSQQRAFNTLPDAPGSTGTPDLATDPTNESSSQQTSTAPTTPTPKPIHEDPQPKRLFGIIPNFRTVTADTKLPPQTVKDKFVTASEDSFDYSSVALAAILAGYADVTNSTPEFGPGGLGYSRYLWHTYTDQTIENYAVEFFVPAIRHEDTRFYSLGKGGFAKRSGYALGHVFVTKSDAGKTTFNSGEIVGAGAAAGISNLYYPRPGRTFGNTAIKWGTNVGIDAATFLFKEFYPDINHKLFHKREYPADGP